MLNKNTQMCISLSSRPSNLGMTLHNSAYAALGLNFIYKAFEVTDLAGALSGVRGLNIRGCSVSMPYKEVVLPLLDDLDETARVIGAVNTIVNDSGRLKGYNTDQAGAIKALEYIGAKPGYKVLLLGAGGVARAIMFALRQMGFNQVQVSIRDPKKIQGLDSILPCEMVPWEFRHKVETDLLINATSIGMSPDIKYCPVDTAFVREVRAVMDVVASPLESFLIKTALSHGKDAAPGYIMSLEQMSEQFRLYTGFVPPRDLIEQQIKQVLID